MLSVSYLANQGHINQVRESETSRVILSLIRNEACELAGKNSSLQDLDELVVQLAAVGIEDLLPAAFNGKKVPVSFGSKILMSNASRTVIEAARFASQPKINDSSPLRKKIQHEIGSEVDVLGRIAQPFVVDQLTYDVDGRCTKRPKFH